MTLYGRGKSVEARPNDQALHSLRTWDGPIPKSIEPVIEKARHSSCRLFPICKFTPRVSELGFNRNDDAIVIDFDLIGHVVDKS